MCIGLDFLDWPERKPTTTQCPPFISDFIYLTKELRDWPSNCQHLPAAEFLPPVDVSRELARHLRTVEQCDFVIALTHMRLTEDLAVSNATGYGDERVDLLLGGHDHNVVCRFADDTDENPEVILQGMTNSDYVNAEGKTINVEGDVRIVKSGTDWRSYSVVKLVVERTEDGKASLQTVKRTKPISPSLVLRVWAL